MERIWLKHYPLGVPSDIEPDMYPSLVDVFAKICSEYHDKPAFYNLGVTITYRQLDEYSCALAVYFQQILHLKIGDRIALMMPNILQYPIALLAAWRAGLVVVNVNPLYTVPELIHQLNDANANTIIVLENFAETVEHALSATALKHIIITELGDLFPLPKRVASRFYLKYIKKKIPTLHFHNAIAFKKMLSRRKKMQLEPVSLDPNDIACLQYTGGTTGVAKGAMLTHRNLIANMLQAEAWFSQVFKVGEEIMITALPLYHIFSLLANALFISKVGGLNILITNPRDIKKMIKEMAKFKFSIITGVNTLFNSLLQQPRFAKLNFSSLKIALGGAMAIQPSVAEKWQSVTGVPILEAYGLTEASPAVTINPTDLKKYNATIGLPISSTDIAILDDAGNELSIGKVGELAVKGPQVMRGYWQNPLETEKVMTKTGWLLTGDIASVNSQGFVSILERKKNMILVSGFNVYPNEIESVLMCISSVVEAAVIGVPDEQTGQAVKAFIVKNNPNLTESDILHFCKENLTGYKLPKYIEFRSVLPKSSIGKILHRALA